MPWSTSSAEHTVPLKVVLVGWKARHDGEQEVEEPATAWCTDPDGRHVTFRFICTPFFIHSPLGAPLSVHGGRGGHQPLCLCS